MELKNIEQIFKLLSDWQMLPITEKEDPTNVVLPFLVNCSDCYWNILSNEENFIRKISIHTLAHSNDEDFKHEQFEIVIK